MVTGSDGRFEFDFFRRASTRCGKKFRPYTQTEPAEGVYTVTLSPAEQSLELDFGNSSCLHDRDLDNDLDVDRDDLLILFAQFGQAARRARGYRLRRHGHAGRFAIAAAAPTLLPPPPAAPAAVLMRTTAVIRADAADRVHSDSAANVPRR